MTNKFINAESAIKKFYKSHAAFYKAVREGGEELYLPVKMGSVFSFLTIYLSPYFKAPKSLVAPVNQGFVNLLRLPGEMMDELAQLGVCHCETFHEAACIDQSGNMRRFSLGSISQVPDAKGGCSVVIKPDRSLVEQVKRGGIYEVEALSECSEWPIQSSVFVKEGAVELGEGEIPCWFQIEEDEAREYEKILPISPGVDRKGKRKARVLSYSFGVYEQVENLVEDLTLGMRLKSPKTFSLTLKDLVVVDRVVDNENKNSNPDLDFYSIEVGDAVKEILSKYETKACFVKPYFSARLDHYLRVVIAHWTACESGKRPVSSQVQKDLHGAPVKFLKEHAKYLAEYSLNRYSSERGAAKGERIKKALHDAEPWLLSALPSILGLWRDHVATLENGMAKDPKKWGDNIKRALVREGLPDRASAAIAALIAPDNTDMSDKYNQIKR